MKNTRMTICLVVAVVAMTAGQGFCDVYFNDGGIHYINYQVGDIVRVNREAPGMGTTVNLGNSAGVWGLFAYNDSRVNNYGGIIGGGFVIGPLAAYDNSQVTMSLGLVRSDLKAYDNSQVTMSLGLVRSDLKAYDNSQVTMTGGEVGGNLKAYNNSQTTIDGGKIWENLYAYNKSYVTISGGIIWGNLYAGDYSQIEWLGGGLRLYYPGKGEIGLTDQAILTIDGFDFAIDGKPFDYGEITSVFGGNYYYESYRRLTGTLANGDIINNDFRIGNDAQIILIPEPATLLLLGLGALMLRKRKQ